jgi:predicted transcriptional regulator
MRELRKLDWIAERDEKNPGKGRPYRIYKLKKGLYDIIDYLETNKRSETDLVMNKISRLKELKSS